MEQVQQIVGIGSQRACVGLAALVQRHRRRLGAALAGVPAR